ncbi:MAG: hypothetical protein COA79_00145 [Planctomycetota bacterium]|nr:MAG: hypothetical protein COA79_00145 [Planctomycetota bacterium]
MKTRRSQKENGQMLIMGAILGIIVMVSSYMLFSVGRVTADKIELQNTADAAAFAAAETMANGVSTMGWLNQAMGTVYFYMANHAANVTVESTKMAFVHHAYNGDKKNLFNSFPNSKRNSIHSDSPFTFGTEKNVIESYEEAYQLAYEWIPRGEIWLWQMAKIQRGVAYISPLMAEKEVYLAIQDGRAERAAIFPKFRMYVDPANNFDLEVHKDFDDGMKQGWEMNGNPGGLVLDVNRDEEDINVTNAYDQNFFIDDPEIWKVDFRYKLNPTDTENELEIESLGKEPPKFETSVYRMKGSFPGWETWRYIRYNPDGTTIISGDGSTVTITNNDDGSTSIEGGGTDITYRRSGNGFEVQNDSGGWDSMGEVDVEIDGVPVKVTTNFNVKIGDITVVNPNLYVIGQTRIHVNKDDIKISTRIGRVWVRTERGEAIFNSLSTLTTDEKWKRPGGAHWGQTLSNQGGDTVRHRLLKIQPDVDWLYQIREIGSYAQEEDDTAHNGNGRFSISNGGEFALASLGINASTLPWLAKPSEQIPANDKDYVKEWYDLKNIYGGKPFERNVGSKKVESYHIIEPCWNPLCIKAGSKGFYAVKYECYDDAGRTTLTKDAADNVVVFTELELCRICYSNHKDFNDGDKVREVGFGGKNSDFPASNFMKKDSRWIAWTDSKSSYNTSLFWKRQFEGESMDDFSEEYLMPAHSAEVRNSDDDYVPLHIKTAIIAVGPNINFSTISSVSFTDSTGSNPLPWDIDHDNDGKADVIMYPNDADNMDNGRDIATWYFIENIADINPSLESLQNLFITAPKPLVLSEDFFKFGINVAVTNDKYDKTIKKKMLGVQEVDANTKSSVMTSINPPSWGMVAIASARCAFWYKGSGGNGGYIFSPGDIDWLKDAEYATQYLEFKSNTIGGEDGRVEFAYDNSISMDTPTEYRMRRQFFVRRHRNNLYTTDWIAKLVPMKFAVRREDLDLEEGDDFDTSARYIYFNLMRTEWRETYIKTSGWKPPENMRLGPNGPSLNTNSEDLEAIITH